MRIVLDTNVVIDALASRAPWNAEAEEIFLMVSGCTRSLFIAVSILLLNIYQHIYKRRIRQSTQ